MILPLIHLNGTGAARLAENYRAAIVAVESAIEALRETAPNGRDYYPIGEGAARQADIEHVLRLREMDAVRSELVLLWVHCDAAVKR